MSKRNANFNTKRRGHGPGTFGLGNSRQRKNRKNGRKNRRRNAGQEVFVSPIKNMPIMTRSLRYSFDDTTTSVDFLVTDLFKIVGFVTSGATTFYPLFQSVKLLSVGLTMLANSSTGAGATSFQWLGTNAPAEKFIMYGAQGVPSKDTYHPPADSSASWWYDRTTSASIDPLFSIDVLGISAEAVVYMDLHFSFVLVDGVSTSLTLTTASSFTGLGYRHLGSATYPAGYIPVDLNLAR